MGTRKFIAALVCAVFAALGMSISSASAGLITYTDSCVGGDSDIAVSAGAKPSKIGGFCDLQLPRFDPALGNLLSVKFAYHGEQTTTGTVYNGTTSAQNVQFWVATNAGIFATHPPFPVALNGGGTSHPTYGSLAVACCGSSMDGIAGGRSLGGGWKFTGADVTGFIGLDPFPLKIGAFNIFQITAPPGVSFSQDFVRMGDVRIQYKFAPYVTPMPEPGTLMLFAVGLAGVFGMCRHMRKGAALAKARA